MENGHHFYLIAGSECGSLDVRGVSPAHSFREPCVVQGMAGEVVVSFGILKSKGKTMLFSLHGHSLRMCEMSL